MFPFLSLVRQSVSPTLLSGDWLSQKLTCQMKQASVIPPKLNQRLTLNKLSKHCLFKRPSVCLSVSHQY